MYFPSSIKPFLPPLLDARVFIPTLPFLSLLAGAGLASLRNREANKTVSLFFLPTIVFFAASLLIIFLNGSVFLSGLYAAMGLTLHLFATYSSDSSTIKQEFLKIVCSKYALILLLILLPCMQVLKSKSGLQLHHNVELRHIVKKYLSTEQNLNVYTDNITRSRMVYYFNFNVPPNVIFLPFDFSQKHKNKSDRNLIFADSSSKCNS